MTINGAHRAGPAASAVATGFSSHDFRKVMGMFATGVTVVTAMTDTPHGMTANAFTSVSKDPPLVLVCVDRGATMHERILQSGAFAVSVLAGCQEKLARYFADSLRPTGFEQFEHVPWASGRHTGAPLLGGAVAWLECRLHESHTAGDHSVFIGSVLDLSRSAEANALLFYSGGFQRIVTDLPSAATRER